MKKQYSTGILLLALIFTASSSVLAEENTANTDFKATVEAQKTALKAQREKMKIEAEARKKAAEAKGDEMQAKREAAKLEMEAKRAEMDAKREAKRVEAEAKRAEMQTKRVVFQQEVAKRKVENTGRVILATIERLEKIIVRLESRIAKVKARGSVTSESEGFVAAAKINLSDARAVVDTFASIDLSSEKAADNFEKIRVAAAKARESIRSAHQNLMMAVRSLGTVEEDRSSEKASTSTEQ